MGEHHPDCDKQWRGNFDQEIDSNSCPTCMALRELEWASVFGEADLPVLERTFAAPGWTPTERGDD